MKRVNGMGLGLTGRVLAGVATLLVGWAAQCAAVEKAKLADTFVDSIGVCTHYNYNDTVYGNFTAIGSKLAELGVRHIRDGSDRTYVWNEWKRINAAYGIKVTANFTPASYWALDKRVGGNLSMIELLKLSPQIVAGIEGPNEPDAAGCTYVKGSQTLKGHTAARTFQEDLFAAVRKETKLAGIPVLAPPMAYPGNTWNLAPMTSFDVATMHSYAGGNRPSTDLDWKWIPSANQMLPAGAMPRPIVATEAGYHTALGNIGNTQPGVSEAAQGKYLPRLFAEYFNRGIVRTFAYELIDEGTGQDQSESNYGLLRNNYTPKPAFTALKNTIGLLKDPGTAFEPGELDYTISGGTGDLHHLLLQKRSGEFDLVLWQEVQSFNLTTKRDIAVETLPVTLKLNEGVWDAKVYLPNQSAAAVATYESLNEVKLDVPDALLIVKLTAVPEAGSMVGVLGLGAMMMGSRRRGIRKPVC